MYKKLKFSLVKKLEHIQNFLINIIAYFAKAIIYTVKILLFIFSITIINLFLLKISIYLITNKFLIAI